MSNSQSMTKSRFRCFLLIYSSFPFSFLLLGIPKNLITSPSNLTDTREGYHVRRTPCYPADECTVYVQRILFQMVWYGPIRGFFYYYYLIFEVFYGVFICEVVIYSGKKKVENGEGGSQPKKECRLIGPTESRNRNTQPHWACVLVALRVCMYGLWDVQMRFHLVELIKSFRKRKKWRIFSSKKELKKNIGKKKKKKRKKEKRKEKSRWG